MKVCGDIEKDTFSCALSTFGGFYKARGIESLKETIRNGRQNPHIHRIKERLFQVAIFINTPECKEAYKVMCKEFDLLYQSPPKRNSLSGNLAFIAVFTKK